MIATAIYPFSNFYGRILELGIWIPSQQESNMNPNDTLFFMAVQGWPQELKVAFKWRPFCEVFATCQLPPYRYEETMLIGEVFRSDLHNMDGAPVM